MKRALLGICGNSEKEENNRREQRIKVEEEEQEEKKVESRKGTHNAAERDRGKCCVGEIGIAQSPKALGLSEITFQKEFGGHVPSRSGFFFFSGSVSTSLTNTSHIFT